MVKIVCRIKPPKKDNIELINDSKIYLYKKDKNLLDKSIIRPYQFELDKFYDYNTKTTEIFNTEIKPNLYKNFGCFIYGHTGSGKTFTLFGNDNNKGIFDLLAEELNFDFQLEAIDLSHNGIFDLFTLDKISLWSNGKEDNCYNCKKHQITIDNYYDFRTKIFESRTRGTSKHNQESSRSHLVLYIHKNDKKYTIVDLAGNERRPLISNKVNELETSFINSSLLALKECFRSFGKSYMPFRRSNLTRLLKNIIKRDNLLICTIHSGHPHFYDSIDTLNYTYGLLNKVKKQPQLFEKKQIDLFKKREDEIKEKNKDKLYPKKIQHPRILPKLELKNKKILNINNINPSLDLSLTGLKISNDEMIEESISDDDSLNEKLEDINYDKDLEKSATKNLDDFENNDHIYDLNNYSEEKYTKSDKIPEKISEFDKNDITISNLLKSDKSLKLKRKLFETINFYIYKKVVSNYKSLLEDEIDEDALDKLCLSTVYSIDQYNAELIKLLK